jgi:hypothetical protein
VFIEKSRLLMGRDLHICNKKTAKKKTGAGQRFYKYRNAGFESACFMLFNSNPLTGPDLY